MHKLLTLLVLLVTSAFAHAHHVHGAELNCVSKSVYHEGRSLTEKHWIKIANVAYNRQAHYSNYNFGAKSKHLCDIVKSKQYVTGRKLRSKIQEKETYEKIVKVLSKANWHTSTNALYFTSIGNKIRYKHNWSK